MKYLFLDPVIILPNDQIEAFTSIWDFLVSYFHKFYLLVQDTFILQLLLLLGIVSAAVEIVIFFQRRQDGDHK